VVQKPEGKNITWKTLSVGGRIIMKWTLKHGVD